MHTPAGTGQQRRAKRVSPERPAYLMERHPGHGLEIGPGAVRHQMHVALARQVRRQCVIGGIHASQRGKVAGDNQPMIQS